MDVRATFGFNLVDDIMDLHMSIIGTLVPEERCCVFYTTMYRIYWSLTYHTIFC